MNELVILKKKDIKNINYLERWHCILAAEDSVLKGKAKREDFYRLVKDCSGDTILNSPINKQVAETSIPMPTEVRSNFKLYPDPAYNLINIEFIADKNVNANIRIFNIAGKMLYEQKSCRFNNENTLKAISLEGFASGLYIMQIETQNKVLREKFIIHR